MSALYSQAWFVDLGYRTDYQGYSVYMASLARADERGGALPASDLHLVFGPLSMRDRQKVLDVLLALGLWSEVPGGYLVHPLPSEDAASTPRLSVETLAPSSACSATVINSEVEHVRQRREADRKRQQRHRQKLRDEASPSVTVSGERSACHASEPLVTLPATIPVTLPARASEENSSFSPSPISKIEEGEESLSSHASETVTVTSPAESVLVSHTTQPSAATDGEGDLVPPPATSETSLALSQQEQQVVAWWSQATGRSITHATPWDLEAVRRRMAEGATLAELCAAITYASKAHWFSKKGTDGLPRNQLSVVCGKLFPDLVKKGMPMRHGLASTLPPTPPVERPELSSEKLRRRYPADHPAFFQVDREGPYVWCGYVWTWNYTSNEWEVQGRAPSAQQVA